MDLCHDDVRCVHVSCHTNLIVLGIMSSQSTLIHVTLVSPHSKKSTDEIYRQASLRNWGATPSTLSPPPLVGTPQMIVKNSC